ncbi:MAG: low molecular weight phosphotyrosine protein phosphatase [Myxococcales bacterium]|nr:low molecular weight phosphotyrosine protein phosphatase [Myxococcales bacterium]MCB9520941.1 low molecular weight phosphotyrosine protein phosphatase [Myxococcales bacterium]MCB9531695.1 low molecular weight phosphotyrosine protein phosphatase [Myxococcales bacterium]MCB9534418.1 low molecular weight phosphotyrosine protein phosphatase [Myxococcales bacterium]
MIRVLFLCLGNICRSPLAEAAFRAHVEARGHTDRFVIDSAATSGHHAGEPPNPGSIRVARAHGLDISAQRSRKLVAADLRQFDFIVPMDRSNQRALIDLPAHRRPLVREFDPECLGTLDVPDPWGGGPEGFEEVWAILVRSVPGLLEHIQHNGKQV